MNKCADNYDGEEVMTTVTAKRMTRLGSNSQPESTPQTSKKDDAMNQRSFEYCHSIARTLPQSNNHSSSQNDLVTLPVTNKPKVLKKKKRSSLPPLFSDDDSTDYCHQNNIYATCAASYGMLDAGYGYMNRGGRQSLMSMLVKKSWF